MSILEVIGEGKEVRIRFLGSAWIKVGLDDLKVIF